jgi:tol-pal system protein YbgF
LHPNFSWVNAVQYSVRGLWLGLVVIVTILESYACNAQSVNPNQAALARQNLRIDQLETEIRRLTGQNEGLNFRLEQLENRLKSLRGSVEANAEKIKEISTKKQLPEMQSQELNRVQNTNPANNRKIPGAEKGARPLGMLKSGEDTFLRESDPGLGLSAEALYEKAQRLVTKYQNFQMAMKLLQSFVKNHPKHSLAPNAYYWLGRTHFVQGNLKMAAFSFAEGFQKFPKSEKASANLFNLGMTLAGLGQISEACMTWKQFLKKFPKSEGTLKRRVEKEIRKAKCS